MFKTTKTILKLAVTVFLTTFTISYAHAQYTPSNNSAVDFKFYNYTQKKIVVWALNSNQAYLVIKPLKHNKEPNLYRGLYSIGSFINGGKMSFYNISSKDAPTLSADNDYKILINNDSCKNLQVEPDNLREGQVVKVIINGTC